MKLLNGYELTTTVWEDFTIADRFGLGAVKDTYKRAFDNWHSNYVYLTELVIVLNHKMWQHYEDESPRGQALAKRENELWEQADGYACEHLKGEEAAFFYRITD